MERASATEDERFMRHALRLALKGEGETNPNPLVGCVLVRSGRIVGQGHHARAGAAHAEVVALERAGERAKGATLYVNLEPCAHEGRTPPCAPRVAASGVARVVVAMRDPNPLVDGRGLSFLRRRGVQVTCGVMEHEARLLNEPFARPFATGRPFVLLKAATTLDGKIATAGGDSKWITSASLRAQARRLRRRCDGVLVGVGTVLADDPLLLPRPRVSRPFFRIVLDSSYRTPVRSRLVRSARQSPLVVIGGDVHPRRRRALERAGARVVVDPRGPGRVRLAFALRALAGLGVTSLMVEGGSEVLGAFLRQRLFDRLALFRAPLLLGGRGSLGAFGGPNPSRVRDALRLRPAPAWPQESRPAALVEHWYPLP